MAEEITYDNYLKVPTLLDCQKPKSEAEIELLFILIHQVFELWFKQVIADLDSIRGKLQLPVTGSALFTMNKQLERAVMIFKLVVQQFAIIETMSPMEFMDFRGYLSPASGFQSLQFRMIEIKLGVKDTDRTQCCGQSYRCSFTEEQNVKMEESLKETTLLKALEKFLEQTPGLVGNEQDFVNRFRGEVKRWLAVNAGKGDNGNKYGESGFENILDEAKYNEDLVKGNRRLSWRAFLGALTIFLYREEPAYSQRCTFLQRLMDLENAVFQWRCTHVMMVNRMIGNKPGTGGSSGVGYLTETISNDKYRVFKDLFNMASYFVPSEYIPQLTEEQRRSLAFVGGE